MCIADAELKYFKNMVFLRRKNARKEGGLFWKSGLWNPSYYLESPKDMKRIISYIRNQKYGKKRNNNQTTLINYAS